MRCGTCSKSTRTREAPGGGVLLGWHQIESGHGYWCPGGTIVGRKNEWTPASDFSGPPEMDMPPKSRGYGKRSRASLILTRFAGGLLDLFIGLLPWMQKVTDTEGNQFWVNTSKRACRRFQSRNGQRIAVYSTRPLGLEGVVVGVARLPKNRMGADRYKLLWFRLDRKKNERVYFSRVMAGSRTLRVI